MEGREEGGDLGPFFDAVGGVVVKGDVHDGAEVVPSSGFRVEGIGCRVQDLGFRL